MLRFGQRHGGPLRLGQANVQSEGDQILHPQRRGRAVRRRRPHRWHWLAPQRTLPQKLGEQLHVHVFIFTNYGSLKHAHGLVQSV